MVLSHGSTLSSANVVWITPGFSVSQDRYARYHNVCCDFQWQISLCCTGFGFVCFAVLRLLALSTAAERRSAFRKSVKVWIMLGMLTVIQALSVVSSYCNGLHFCSVEGAHIQKWELIKWDTFEKALSIFV